MDSFQYNNFYNEFMDESDRASIVLAAAHIDELLKEILEARLIDVKKDIFKMNGPLSSFSSRIEFSYSLGILSKEFVNKLHILRGMRNDCAHKTTPIDFESKIIKEKIHELSSTFKSMSHWEDLLQEAGNIYKLDGERLVLRFSITLFVANLSIIKNDVKKIESNCVKSPFFP